MSGAVCALILVSLATLGDATYYARNVCHANLQRRLTLRELEHARAAVGGPIEVGVDTHTGRPFLSMYADSSAGDRLRTSLGHNVVRSMYLLSREQRCSPAVHDAFNHTSDGGDVNAWLWNRRASLSRTRTSTSVLGVERLLAADQPRECRMRALMHPGAAAYVSSDALRAQTSALLTSVAADWSLDADNTNIVATAATNVAYDHLAHALASIDGVAWVEPDTRVRTQNVWSSSAAQVLDGAERSLAAAVACAETSACSPLWRANLRGSGQIVAVADTGIATSSCFFADAQHTYPVIESTVCPFSPACVPADTNHRKIRAWWTGTGGDRRDDDGHGTHIAGMVGGSAARGARGRDQTVNSADFDGLAPDVRFVFVDMQRGTSESLSVPRPLDTRLCATVYALGARVLVGSWGAPSFGAYTSLDAEIDRFVYTHRDFVAVFAAGNDGPVANSMMAPAVAKNALAVAAGMNGPAAADLAFDGRVGGHANAAYGMDVLAAFSSRGGAAARYTWLKPDIVAAGGYYEWSANAGAESTGTCSSINADIVGFAGTSQGAPNVGGMAILIRQYCIEGRYPVDSNQRRGFTPSSALVRGIILAGARPMRLVFPTTTISASPASAYAPYGVGYLQGAGRMDASRSLDIANERWNTRTLILADEHESMRLDDDGQAWRYCVDMRVPSTATHVNVRVVLIWSDEPDVLSSVSRASIMNDLDLRVDVVRASTSQRQRLSVNRLPVTSSDRWSPSERASIDIVMVPGDGGRIQLAIDAYAHRILSAGGQTFALVLVASVATSQTSERVQVFVDGRVPTHRDDVTFSNAASSGQCIVCTSSSSFRSQSRCSIAPPPPPPPPVITTTTSSTTTTRRPVTPVPTQTTRARTPVPTTTTTTTRRPVTPVPTRTRTPAPTTLRNAANRMNRCVWLWALIMALLGWSWRAH